MATTELKTEKSGAHKRTVVILKPEHEKAWGDLEEAFNELAIGLRATEEVEFFGPKVRRQTASAAAYAESLACAVREARIIDRTRDLRERPDELVEEKLSTVSQALWSITDRMRVLREVLADKSQDYSKIDAVLEKGTNISGLLRKLREECVTPP